MKQIVTPIGLNPKARLERAGLLLLVPRQTVPQRDPKGQRYQRVGPRALLRVRCALIFWPHLLCEASVLVRSPVPGAGH